MPRKRSNIKSHAKHLPVEYHKKKQKINEVIILIIVIALIIGCLVFMFAALKDAADYYDQQHTQTESGDVIKEE